MAAQHQVGKRGAPHGAPRFVLGPWYKIPMPKHCDSCTCDAPARAKAPRVTEPTTVRIVRPGHIFMKGRGGMAVEVPDRLLEHRSTLLATVSVEEWKAETDRQRDAINRPPAQDSVKLAQDFQKRQRGIDASKKKPADAAPTES